MITELWSYSERRVRRPHGEDRRRHCAERHRRTRGWQARGTHTQAAVRHRPISDARWLLDLHGRYLRHQAAERSGLQALRQVDTIFDLIKSYGLTVEDCIHHGPAEYLFSDSGTATARPHRDEPTGILPYPFPPNIRPDAFNPEHVAMKGVPGLAATWASPVKLNGKTDVIREHGLDEGGRRSSLYRRDLAANTFM